MIFILNHFPACAFFLVFQATLLEGLAIDYNLVFKGSICSREQKKQSRAILVATQRKILQLLVQFVQVCLNKS